VDLEWLKALVALMNQNDLAELVVEEDGRKIKLRKAGDPVLRGTPFVLPAAAAQAAPPAAAAGAAARGAARPATGDGAKGEAAADLAEIKSPMVGTFYRSPSPESDTYVDVGDAVKEETTLCIIEAMKVMNEIKAEMTGVVKEILVANGEAVEFGQPLFVIQRSAG